VWLRQISFAYFQENMVDVVSFAYEKTKKLSHVKNEKKT
jgi:hypothetical protein